MACRRPVGSPCGTCKDYVKMKIYIVQIDMAEDGVEWQNADLAFKTREQAEADVEWKIQHYGIDRRHLRVVDLELV